MMAATLMEVDDGNDWLVKEGVSLLGAEVHALLELEREDVSLACCLWIDLCEN